VASSTIPLVCSFSLRAPVRGFPFFSFFHQDRVSCRFFFFSAIWCRACFYSTISLSPFPPPLRAKPGFDKAVPLPPYPSDREQSTVITFFSSFPYLVRDHKQSRVSRLPFFRLGIAQGLFSFEPRGWRQRSSFFSAKGSDPQSLFFPPFPLSPKSRTNDRSNAALFLFPLPPFPFPRKDGDRERVPLFLRNAGLLCTLFLPPLFQERRPPFFLSLFFPSELGDQPGCCGRSRFPFFPFPPLVPGRFDKAPRWLFSHAFFPKKSPCSATATPFFFFSLPNDPHSKRTATSHADLPRLPPLSLRICQQALPLARSPRRLPPLSPPLGLTTFVL